MEDLQLLPGGGVDHPHLEQEPVALHLGEGIHALGLDGVLRGQHDERPGQRMGAPRQADLALGHDLQQGRLHLGGRPVDLVGEQEVDEHRPELDVEALAGRVVHPGADDVARHEVGGELDAGEGAAHHGGERGGRERLGDARHPFEKAVTAGEQRHQQSFDHVVLADDDAPDLCEGLLEETEVRVGTFVRSGSVTAFFRNGHAAIPSNTAQRCTAPSR